MSKRKRYFRDLLIFTIICSICAAAFGFFAPMVPVVAAEDCRFVYHDHYKTNYRIRHKHQICGKVVDHYKTEEAFTVDVLYLPEFYLTEDEGTVDDKDK